ncbi:MAG: nucleoside-diphosphate sugar epimerase/dehydratase, partial [Candidatus Nanopelagicales bacterium]
DARGKRHLTLSGIPVRGGRQLLVETARSTGARAVIVAIADASPELLTDVAVRARECGIEVKTIPSLAELVNATVTESQVRDLDVTDFLRRRPIATDTTNISRLLRGKRVLVTGAGGSIGAELSRQVHAFAPSKLYLLDRDESALHSLQLSLSGQALLDDDSTVLADIRDAQRMRQLMHQLRPDVVFHAAALKHLPLLERNPSEAVKSNVLGTQNVLDAATSVGVPIFVNISTDKAADPISVLGYSKRITERLTAAAAESAKGSYVSVRFGNVLGSRGSVLTAFGSQIAAGGPVTVTHPQVTRYFMTIPEAVQLVLQAAAIGSNGDALVLDMGEPVAIVDVARQMIDHSGRDIEIVYTGLRDGEKLDEALFAANETPHPTEHPLISRVHVPPLCRDSLDALNHGSDGAVLVQAMELLSMGTIDLGHDAAVRVE